MPGPVPNRSDQRRRRNKDGRTDKAPGFPRPVPPDPDEDWHPIAKSWFAALSQSGQSAFYEASDWQHARFVAEGMSRCLSAGRLSAQMFSAVDSASTRLLVTEGDRRRMRLELERAGGDGEDPAVVAQMNDYRSRFSG